jgi:hypothetical protein
VRGLHGTSKTIILLQYAAECCRLPLLSYKGNALHKPDACNMQLLPLL